MARGAFRFGTDLWDPTHRFETSWLLSPWLLFFCRALITLYIFTTILFVLGWQCANAETHCSAARLTFSYFTSLSYWGLGFYYLAASIHTFTYARSGVALLDKFPRPLQALHSALYSTIIVFPFIVTVVYWARIFTGPWFTEMYAGWSNVSQHALNSVFAIFEIVVPRTDTPPLVHMLWLIVLLAMYLALAYVTKASKGIYPYEFLDPTEQGAFVAAYVFGIAVGCLIVFGLAYGAVCLRKHLTETKPGRFAGPADGSATAKDLEMARPHETSVA